MTSVAMDSDVLYKGCCYGLMWALIEAIPAHPEDVGYLAAARFVLASKLRRAKLVGKPDDYRAAIEAAIQRGETLEPSEEEVRIAAELEYAAQLQNLPLDAGESQLCAIVVVRGLSKLVTGDKRAIVALEVLARTRSEPRQLAGRLACFEELVRAVVDARGASAVRAAVCSEPRVDRALAICFSCSSPEVPPASWTSGLMSYIGDLRKSAPTLMAPASDT